MDKYIYGGDTETIHGRPMSLQFYSEDTACDDIFFVSEKTAAKRFFAWCARRRKNVQHVVYIHNLSFDLIELLWGFHAKLVSADGEFRFTVGGMSGGPWSVTGVYGTPTFCRFSNGGGVTVTLIDSYSFFKSSLEKGAELFCPDLPKLKRPRDLGERIFKPSDTKFCEYARRDAVVGYHMGAAIEKLHRTYDLTQCVSIADMAARIFRHRYLSYTIPQPSTEIVHLALGSYHGGKNNTTVKPGWYEGVTSLDISSAYPHAMSTFPAFSNAKLYKKITCKVRTKSVPDLGVYHVSGKVSECKWPSVFSSGFKPLQGVIRDVPMQGFELNEALRSGELKASKIKGFYYDRERDNQAPALREFCNEFYRLKQAASDKVLREMFKLIQNAISGKFIQTRKRGTCVFTDVDANETTMASELVAGGMFHPFIASATTAKPRARMHRIEHYYEAMHTATDGILTQSRIRFDPSGRSELLPMKKPKLGALTVEAEDSTVCLLRNKCYVQYTSKNNKTFPSQVFKGKHIRKYALHGFQGRVSDLERLIASGRRAYFASRPNRLKESLKRGLVPNDFVKRRYVLKIGPLEVHT